MFFQSYLLVDILGGFGQGRALLYLGAAALLFVIRREADLNRNWKCRGPGRNEGPVPKSGFGTHGFACVLLHLVKQQCRKYIHNDVFA